MKLKLADKMAKTQTSGLLKPIPLSETPPSKSRTNKAIMKITVKPMLRKNFVRGSICFVISAVIAFAIMLMITAIKGIDNGMLSCSKWSMTKIDKKDSKSSIWNRTFSLFFILHLVLIVFAAFSILQVVIHCNGGD